MPFVQGAEMSGGLLFAFFPVVHYALQISIGRREFSGVINMGSELFLKEIYLDIDERSE